MAKCLYCQQENSAANTACEHCGMQLPQLTEQKQAQRLSRFKWFVIGLTIFCFIMMFWLPRTVPPVN